MTKIPEENKRKCRSINFKQPLNGVFNTHKKKLSALPLSFRRSCALQTLTNCSLSLPPPHSWRCQLPRCPRQIDTSYNSDQSSCTLNLTENSRRLPTPVSMMRWRNKEKKRKRACLAKHLPRGRQAVFNAYRVMHVRYMLPIQVEEFLHKLKGPRGGPTVVTRDGVRPTVR